MLNFEFPINVQIYERNDIGITETSYFLLIKIHNKMRISYWMIVYLCKRKGLFRNLVQYYLWKKIFVLSHRKMILDLRYKFYNILIK